MSSRIAAGLPPLKRTPGETGAPGVGTKNLQKASHTEKSKNFENGIERVGILVGFDIPISEEVLELGFSYSGILALLLQSLLAWKWVPQPMSLI